MKMPKFRAVHMLEATPAEVEQFAVIMGLEVEAGDDTNTLMSKIMAANGASETILVPLPDDDVDMAGDPPPFAPGATAPIAPVGTGAMAGSLGHDDPKVTILIHNEERNGSLYDRDVEVGVNGRCWLLKRNVSIEIPYRVYMALKSAVTDSVTIDPTTFAEIHTPVARYAHSVEDMPSRAEIAEWRERTDAIELV